jgi:hypothetical protein
MGILLIVALILAWPTYGLSLLAWIVLAFFKAKSKAAKAARREEIKESIEPLFQGRFAEFFMELDIPIYSWEEITPAEAHQCGRLVMNYIAHNLSETRLFMQGLQKWGFNPVLAARGESSGKKGEIHMVCYRAVEALTTNNKLKCFEKIDVLDVVKERAMLEINETFAQLR